LSKKIYMHLLQFIITWKSLQKNDFAEKDLIKWFYAREGFGQMPFMQRNLFEWFYNGKGFLANRLNDFMLEKNLGKWFYEKEFDWMIL